MKLTHFLAGILTGLIIAALLGYPGPDSVAAAIDASERVFELRTYHTNPGKLEDLHTRFRDHTNALFVKHDMSLIGYWTPTEGDAANDTLIYLLAHDSRESARASWEAFFNDPEWKAAHAESNEHGKIVKGLESVFMTSTDYSPIR